MFTVVNGKRVRIRPGRLIVGFTKDFSPANARKLISKFGGIVESIYKPNVADVNVPQDQTLDIYNELCKIKEEKASGVRFVSFDLFGG